MDEATVRTRLFQAYQTALGDPAHQFTEEEAQGLSGIFLPDVTAAYCASPLRLMIVGQETRGWNGALKNYRHGEDFDAFIGKQREHYGKWLTCRPGKSPFLQAHRTLGKRANGQAIWANTFAICHKKGSPTGHTAIGKIQQLSAQLLKSQIEILQPHGVLFTSGWRYDQYLKACFGDAIHGTEVRERKKLWRFKIGDTLCFRTSHPRYVADNAQRETAIAELLALA